MNTLIIGVALIFAAVAMFAASLFASPVRRVDKSRRSLSKEPEVPAWRTAAHSVVDGVDDLLKQRSWAPFRASELEMADVKMAPAMVLTWLIAGAGLVFLAGAALRGIVVGAFLALLVPIAAKVALRVRAGRRRRAFGKQLDSTLRVVATALRAGHSLPTALSSVAADAQAPMAEELTQVINENRIGRDLVTALHDSAARMKSEDLAWFAGAVAVQRDAGGNLNDIIDTVAETIRERAEIREKIRAYASEGKASAYVLMALPVALGVLYSVMNPGYLDPLFTTTIGNLLLAGSSVLYVVAFFWMRAIVNFKV